MWEDKQGSDGDEEKTEKGEGRQKDDKKWVGIKHTFSFLSHVQDD